MRRVGHRQPPKQHRPAAHQEGAPPDDVPHGHTSLRAEVIEGRAPTTFRPAKSRRNQRGRTGSSGAGAAKRRRRSSAGTGVKSVSATRRPHRRPRVALAGEVQPRPPVFQFPAPTCAINVKTWRSGMKSGKDMDAKLGVWWVVHGGEMRGNFRENDAGASSRREAGRASTIGGQRQEPAARSYGRRHIF